MNIRRVCPPILSVFVDESGNFCFPDAESRFYIIGMVFHDQAVDISREIAILERSDAEIGLQGHCFHAGPLIRREKNCSMLSRQLRGRIFARMMAFARKVDMQSSMKPKCAKPEMRTDAA